MELNLCPYILTSSTSDFIKMLNEVGSSNCLNDTLSSFAILSNENKRLTASFKNKSLDEIIRFIEKVLNVKIEKVKQ